MKRRRKKPEATQLISQSTLVTLICLVTAASMTPMVLSCYRPWDDEWEWFEYAKRYRGICRTKGNGCADACRSDGKSGGRCVLTGDFFWSCSCMCYKDGYPIDKSSNKHKADKNKVVFVVVKNDQFLHLSSLPVQNFFGQPSMTTQSPYVHPLED
jgi:ribonuclease PH